MRHTGQEFITAPPCLIANDDIPQFRQRCGGSSFSFRSCQGCPKLLRADQTADRIGFGRLLKDLFLFCALHILQYRPPLVLQLLHMILQTEGRPALLLLFLLR